MTAAQPIFAITLAVPDLTECKVFYQKVFAAAEVFEDAVSVVFNFGGVLINLLQEHESARLFSPAALALESAGHRSMITIHVENVDSEAERLLAAGIILNSEPKDQPWGIRTITFADPSGQLWEFSQPISSEG